MLTSSGASYYRARYYDPSAGRFISEDPTQFDGGTNFYAYVQNSPIDLTDPLGLAQCVYSISQHTLRCFSNFAPPVGPRRSAQVGPNNVSSGDGKCKNKPECTGTDHEGHGPIPPGEYKMNADPRKGNEGQFRLEPQPTVAGWRVWLPGWMPGAARGGFRLHLGSRTHGCINALWDDPSTRAQYQTMLDLLKSEDGNNWLLVTQ
jgi:uncharacterized protein RhaS with RHS repeats